MKQLWTLGVLALFAIPAVGCGNSSPATQTTIPRAFFKLSLPERVVAVPSTDSDFAMEAAIPMVVSETAGVGAQIERLGVEVTDEASGVRSDAVVSRTTPVEHISPRGTVELPFRVYVKSTAAYRATVTLYVWDDGAPPSTGAGDVQLWVNQRSGERSQFSGQLRILPPQ
jgi:hypothetical protein